MLDKKSKKNMNINKKYLTMLKNMIKEIIILLFFNLLILQFYYFILGLSIISLIFIYKI